MEYVHGISVKQYIARHGHMSGEEVLDGIRPLLLSIQKIHEKGILHRDISADNLMITPEGRCKLIDFGAASALDPQRKEHTVLIKRGFVPVEQYRAEEKLGPWTDIYSLCATIYFMITGMVPEDAMERWISDTMTSLTDIYGTGLTREQCQAVMKGMAVRQEDRYQDAAQLYCALYAQDNIPQTESWYQTEDLSYQTMSGHTGSLRREAAKALNGKGRVGKLSFCLAGSGRTGKPSFRLAGSGRAGKWSLHRTLRGSGRVGKLAWLAAAGLVIAAGAWFYLGRNENTWFFCGQ